MLRVRNERSKRDQALDRAHGSANGSANGHAHSGVHGQADGRASPLSAEVFAAQHDWVRRRSLLLSC